MSFVNRMDWPGKAAYMNSVRQPLVDPETGQTETIVKAKSDFKYYWILRAGHSVSVHLQYTISLTLLCLCIPF